MLLTGGKMLATAGAGTSCPCSRVRNGSSRSVHNVNNRRVLSSFNNNSSGTATEGLFNFRTYNHNDNYSNVSRRRSRALVIAASSSNGGGSQRLFEEAADRQQLINTISPVYDQRNDLLSLGQHRVWKRTAVKWAVWFPA